MAYGGADIERVMETLMTVRTRRAGGSGTWPGLAGGGLAEEEVSD